MLSLYEREQFRKQELVRINKPWTLAICHNKLPRKSTRKIVDKIRPLPLT